MTESSSGVRADLLAALRTAASRVVDAAARYDDACATGGAKRIRDTRPAYEEAISDLRDILAEIETGGMSSQPRGANGSAIARGEG